MSHYNPKISASNSLYFWRYSRKYTYFRYTNFDLLFLCIFITALSPVSHSYFCSRKENALEAKLYKMCLRDQGRSVKSENTHVKMGTSIFKTTFSLFRTLKRNKVLCEILPNSCTKKYLGWG